LLQNKTLFNIFILSLILLKIDNQIDFSVISLIG